MKKENIITEKVETGFTKDIEYWINLLEKPFDKSVFLYDFFPVKALKYDSYHFQINKDLTNKLFNICSSIDSKLFGLLTSSLIGLLNKYTSNEDIVIAIPIYKQSTEGSYNNTFLPLRINVNDNFDYKKLVFQVVNNINEVITHQNFPLKKVSKLISQDDLDSSIDIKILSHDIHDVRNIDSDFQSNFNLLYEKKDECIDCEIRYNASLYKSDTIKRIANHFVHFTEKCIAKNDVPFQEISLLSESEENRLLYEFNNTKSDYPRKENIISLFEEQVNKNSGRIALVFNEKQISYKFLNQRANKLAHYLRNEGTKEGNSVALMIDRSLEMIIGIIAILKTGGKYLPIDTSQPESRIKNILHDSNTNIILMKQNLEGFSDDTFNIIDINDEEINKCNDKNLNIQISSDSIAYTIYTSGSTGKPKGVMISHTPVINLVYSETDEFELDKEEKILQFSPIFFDPSVEQMWLALFNGASLILLSKENLLDQDLFNNYIKKHKVTHFPVTPSYLESIELSNPNSVKRIVAGGETCNMQLAQKYCNDYNFYNVYGPTETTVNSIECLVTPDMIDGTRLPIGKPIKNTNIYILGRNLELLAIGVKGELWIGGDGLSKGYNNDSQLTKERFLDNPFVQGEKIYRTGDFARWLPDGNIDFLGRIDNQLKIRGFRIELGEIESQISTYDNIEKAVVLAKGDDGDKYLVAFYVSEKEIEAVDLRDHLSQRIPDYMIPSYFVHMKSLPLNSNGKLDTKALPDEKIKASTVYIAPETKEEKILADVWSKVLGIDNISITDNFFSVGGDSIKSIQISSRMRSKGYGVTVNDIFTNQTIKELSKKLKIAGIESDQELITGKSLPTPIQQLFFETDYTDRNYFNQSVILHFTKGVSERTIRMIFEKLQTHHDALRMVCKQEGSETILQNMDGDFPISLEEFDFKKESNPEIVISSKCSVIQSSIHLENGPLIKLGLFHTNDGSHLLIVIHHLVIDGISWRIIFEDIESLYQQVISNKPLSLPFKTDPFLSWSEKLSEYSRSKSFEESKPYWNKVLSKKTIPINRDYPNEDNIIKDCKMKSFQLNKEETTKLLTEVHSSFNTKINDILLAALYLSIRKLYDCKNVMLDLESHGREQIHQNIDITRTIGWFTSFFPVIIESDENNLALIIKHVKENLRRVPNNGIDFLLINNMNRSSSNKNTFDNHVSQISFNYLGQFDADLASKTFLISDINKGNDISPNNTRNYDWDISGIIKGKQLELSLTYSIKQYKDETIISFMDCYKESLKEVINFCNSYGRVELTPSDLTYNKISDDALVELQHKFELEDVYPLTPLQEGLLFHSKLDQDSDAFCMQINYQIESNLDIAIIEKSLNDLFKRHTIFRSVFLHEGYKRPIQAVLKKRKIDFSFINVREECLISAKEEIILSEKLIEKSRKYSLSQDVLLRLKVLQTKEDEFQFIWSFHHIVMDGWSIAILHNEFTEIYNSYLDNRQNNLLPVTPYREYIKWLEDQNKEKSGDFWHEYLNGYEKTSIVPRTKSASSTEDTFERAEIVFNITKEKTAGLNKIAQKNKLTLYTILKTIWGILLGRYNNTNDVVFGTVRSGRPSDVSGIESMIGLFINTIPVRIKYEEDMTLIDLFMKVKQEAMNCEEHSSCSLADIQTKSVLKQNLFDHIIGYENYPVDERIEEITKLNRNNKHGFKFEITDIEVFEQSNYDFGVIILPGDELVIKIIYNANVFEDDFIKNIYCHINNVTDQLINNEKLIMKNVTLLSEEDKRQILDEFNDIKTDYSIDKTIPELFEEQVNNTPEKIALSLNYDLTNVFESLQDETTVKEDLEQLGQCCFKKDKYIYEHVFDFDNNIILLKNHYHKNIIVNKNMLNLLNILNEGINVKSIYNSLKDKKIQFIILSVSMDDLLEIRYGAKNTLVSIFNDSYENFVKLFKLLYTNDFIDLVDYKSQDINNSDLINGFNESIVEDTTYITDEIFSLRKDISKAKVLLLGDTPGMASIGILYLGSFLMRHGIKCYCQLFDDNCDNDSLRDNLKTLIDKAQPEIIGLSMKWFPHIDRVIETSKIIKEIAPDIKVVVGGNSASFYYKEVIENGTIDYIIRGDGELPLLKLCEGEKDIPNLIHVSDGKLIDNPVSYVVDNEVDSKDIYLSHLEDILLSKYSSILGTFYIHTQKGCAMNCFFCAGCEKGQERTFNRKISYRRTVEEIRKDIIESQKYTSTYRFEFEDDNPVLVKYCEDMWDGIDLTAHFCDVTHAYPPSAELISLLNRTFKYVFWNLDLASLSEKHRIYLFGLDQVKPQPSDRKIHECFKEWDKYDNCDVKINSISGLPYFTDEDIKHSEKLLIDILNNYTSLSELHWGRLHAQPAAPIVDDLETYEMVSHGHLYDDYLKFSQQNMTSELYPTIEDYSYPYLYYKEDSFNSQITKHYAKMSHMIKQYAQSKRMKLLAFNHITYRELNEKSNQLARTLESKGVECGQVVGLMFENSIEMMVSILAVLKLRGTYLPIDPTYPDSAIDYFIKNSGMKIILTQQNFLTNVNTQKFSLLEEVVVVDNDIYKGDSSNLNLDYKLDDLAYLIYTSGTTGRPKGTLIEQKSITNYTKWRINNYKITKDDNSIQLLSYCFDGFGSNVYSTLLSGGTLVIIPESKRMDFSFIKEVIQYSDVTNISMVPSMFQRLIDYSQNGDLDSLRFIVMAGEKGSKGLLQKIKEKTNDLLIINEYGPTEATVTATAKFDLSEDSVTNIGKPIGNVKIYVLDKSQRILPVDVPGELYIGGMGLARGYHNNFELTKEKFIQNPYNEKEKLYRTGDIVKWLPDGNIEYIGRTDNQVKVRGYRIELNEIEKLLQGHEEIKEVVVIDKENKMGEVSLYAFFVLKDTTKELLASEIRKYLSKILPDYMIPSYFTKLENIPLNPNGKADLKALKMIEVNINSEAEFVSPQDSLEESIASIWKEVLEIEKVGRNDNFFDLGGNSLNILRINNELKLKMALDIPVVTLFNYPTISSLSQYIEKDERKEIFTQSDSDRLAKGKNKLKNLRSKTGSIR